MIARHAHSGYTFAPHEVVQAMRQTLRLQVSESYTERHKAIARFIFSNGLLKLTEWPGWVISVTPEGQDYLCEHDRGESDD